MIYIVCGPARSGTSLLMQRLGESGIPLHGEQWPSFRDRQFQPNGYWENELTINGDIARVPGGYAVKVHPYKLYKLNLSSCKIITPIRDVAAIVASQIRFGLDGTTVETVLDEYSRTEKVRHFTTRFTDLVEGTHGDLLR